MSGVLSPHEIDLLSAAFLRHPDAVIGWRRWRDSVDWEGPVGAGAFALLPRVCRNLRAIGADDPLFPRFKGIARQAWVNNQHLKATIASWLDSMPSVEFMALPPTSFLFADGSAIALQGRWFHFAVHAGQAAIAVRSLLRAGWTPSGVRVPKHLIDGYVLGAGHMSLNHAGTDTLTLTWRIENWFGVHSDEVWRESGPAGRAVRSVRTPCPSDVLTYSLRQPVAGDPFRWVSNVLHVASDPVDWNRVHRFLDSRPLNVECAGLLPLVDRCLESVHRSDSSRRWPLAPPGEDPATRPSGALRDRLWRDWRTYREAWGGEYRLGKALVQFPGYLMGRWRIPSLGRVPLGAVAWLRSGDATRR